MKWQPRKKVSLSGVLANYICKKRSVSLLTSWKDLYGLLQMEEPDGIRALLH